MPLGIEVGLGPGDFVFDGDSAPSGKMASPHPIFGPCLLWPNDWMTQDATWYKGKPRPSRRSVRWGRSSALKEAQPQFSFHVYCGQTAGWMKTPHGTEVDLGPCLVSATKTAQHRALLGPCLLWRRSPVSATAEHLLLVFYYGVR